ncbi:MAG: hypothetical protein K2Q26_15270 [Bdellovibrionales bacterium]|nr:hypothetical protein [Bdellovibrionales bacterium]
MKPIIFVTGKGGVGKSFVAALLARQLALKGHKTLLVETGGWSYLQQVLSLQSPVEFKPQKTPWGFDISLWTGEDCLREYVQYLVKIPWVGSQFLNNSWLKSLIQVAPGLREIAFLGKLTSRERRHGPVLNYEYIVVDAVSTGHFLALLKAPIGWSSAITIGPVYTQCQSMLKVLNDPDKVHTYLVTLPEPLVVEEAEDLNREFKSILQSGLTVVANRIKNFPDLLSAEAVDQEYIEQQQLQKQDQQRQLEEIQKVFGKHMSVPFYYKPLAEVLEGIDESQPIF